MKKIFLFFLAILMLVSCGDSKDENTLYVYSWADYIPQFVYEDFENEPRIIRNNPSMPITISLTKQNASSLDYMFRAWVKKEDYIDTMLDCNINVKKFFDKNGIEIPYNKLDLYVKNNINIDNK